MENKTKPVKTVKFGPVQVAVWERTVDKNGKSFVSKSVSVSKNYKGKDGKWASTNSFSMSDLPYVIEALGKVFAENFSRNEIDDVSFDGD